jgi:hypothetical protein
MDKALCLLSYLVTLFAERWSMSWMCPIRGLWKKYLWWVSSYQSIIFGLAICQCRQSWDGGSKIGEVFAWRDWENHENLREDSRCPSRDANKGPPNMYQKCYRSIWLARYIRIVFFFLFQSPSWSANNSEISPRIWWIILETTWKISGIGMFYLAYVQDNS